MVNTYTQAINPIRSDIWLPFRDQFTVSGIKSTSSYGGQTDIQTIQLGDGYASSTYPSMIGSKGFRFKGFEYLNTNSFTLSDNFSIGMLIRPKLYGDSYICGFSNGGGILIKDTSSSDELTYYDGTTTVSSGVVLEKERFYFIMVTKDASNNIKFYINGDLEGTGVGTDSGFDLDYVGCDDSLSNFYIGELREFFVFSETLVGIQIGELNSYLYRNIQDQDIYVPTASDPLSDGELATWDGLQVWLDPKNVASLTMGAAPTINDGDMETAGVGDWEEAVYTATVTKETLSPYEGVRWLKVASTGIQKANQNTVVTTGNRYNVTCAMAGDGSAGYGSISFGGIAFDINSTTSATWQTIDTDLTALGSNINLFCRATGFAKFDDITLENISITAITPRAGALASAFSQATATAQPWIDSTTGAMRFAGTADYLQYAGAASDFSFIHTSGDSSLVVVAKFDNTTGVHMLLNNYSGDGFILQNVSGTRNVAMYMTNDAGSQNVLSSGSEIDAGNMQLFEVHTYSGNSYLHVDSSTAVASNAFTASTGVSIQPLFITRSTGYHVGEVGDIVAFNRVLTATERTRLRNKLAVKWGITLP